MAEVYKRAGGMKVERLIALHVDTQDGLDDATLRLAGKAEAVLAGHRHDGHAFIDVQQGDVDRYVVLNDERGQAAAMTIEYGRGPDSPQGPSEPVAPLRLAAGIGLDRRFIGPRRRNGTTVKKKRRR